MRTSFAFFKQMFVSRKPTYSFISNCPAPLPKAHTSTFRADQGPVSKKGFCSDNVMEINHTSMSCCQCPEFEIISKGNPGSNQKHWHLGYVGKSFQVGVWVCNPPTPLKPNLYPRGRGQGAAQAILVMKHVTDSSLPRMRTIIPAKVV